MVAAPTSTALQMERASAICPSLGAIAPRTGATTALVRRDPFASASSPRSSPPDIVPTRPRALSANASPTNSAWSAGRALLSQNNPAACRARQSVATAPTSVEATATAGAATSVEPPTRSAASLSCPTRTIARLPDSVPLQNHEDGNPEIVRFALRSPTHQPHPARFARPRAMVRGEQSSPAPHLALEAEQNVRGPLIGRRERVLLELP
jgi:hypothetical protein